METSRELDRPIPASGNATDCLRGFLLAALLLGAVDAVIATSSARALAPSLTLPITLSAPFVLSLTLLALPTILLRVLVAAPAEALTGWLVGGCASFALLRAGSVAVDMVGLPAAHLGFDDVPFGETIGWMVSLAAWLLLAAPLGRFATTMLARIGATPRRILQAAACVVPLVAACVLLARIGMEGRGVARQWLGRTAHAATSLGRSAATAARSCVTRGVDSRERLNLLLITVDTLRADHLDPERMPRTVALAEQGARFTSAFSTAPWTLPALAGLMTGRSLDEHEAGLPIGDGPLDRTPLAADVPTLAERLRAAGYRTQAIVTNPYLSLRYGLGAGFTQFENVSLEMELGQLLAPTLAGSVLSELLPDGLETDLGRAITWRAAESLARVACAGPFFLWLHYLDTHAPYDGTNRSFRGELLAGASASGASAQPGSVSKDDALPPAEAAGRLPAMALLRAGEIRPSHAGRKRIEAAYRRAVQSVDREIGNVLDALDRAGASARTLVVVTADHGEELWDHGGVEHGHTLYDELLRVPLVVRLPSMIPARQEVSDLVGTHALPATVLELLGLEVPLDLEASFASLASPGLQREGGRLGRDRPVVSGNLLFEEDRFALRSATHTYVRWCNGKEEIYDRRTDPREQRDLAADDRALALHRAMLPLAARAQGCGARAMREVAASPTSETVRLNEALRALGYVF